VRRMMTVRPSRAGRSNPTAPSPSGEAKRISTEGPQRASGRPRSQRRRSSMTKYLVERYLPGLTPEQLAAAAGSAKRTTETMTQEGTPVQYLRSTFIPERRSASASSRDHRRRWCGPPTTGPSCPMSVSSRRSTSPLTTSGSGRGSSPRRVNGPSAAVVAATQEPQEVGYASVLSLSIARGRRAP
jgi:hypothetical protein